MEETGHGESAETVGEAYAEYAVKEFEPGKANEQGESTETVGKAFAKHHVTGSNEDSLCGGGGGRGFGGGLHAA